MKCSRPICKSNKEATFLLSFMGLQAKPVCDDCKESFTKVFGQTAAEKSFAPIDELEKNQ